MLTITMFYNVLDSEKLMADLNGRFDRKIGWQINYEGDKCSEELSIVHLTNQHSIGRIYRNISTQI